MFTSWLKDKIWRISIYFRWTGYRKMQIKIVRVDATDKGIFGHLTCENFECITLERHDIAIPTGTYKAVPYKSPSRGDVLLLQGVPHRSWIEIHSGNKEEDSLGCILVGYKRNGYNLEYPARQALLDLLKKVQGANDIWVTIV